MKCCVASQASMRRPWQWSICFFPGCTHPSTRMRGGRAKGDRTAKEIWHQRRQERANNTGRAQRESERLPNPVSDKEWPGYWLCGSLDASQPPLVFAHIAKELGSDSAIKGPGGGGGVIGGGVIRWFCQDHGDGSRRAEAVNRSVSDMLACCYKMIDGALMLIIDERQADPEPRTSSHIEGFT